MWLSAHGNGIHQVWDGPDKQQLPKYSHIRPGKEEKYSNFSVF